MDFSDNLWYMIGVAVTSILILASTIYTLRNIFTIWRKGSPTPEQISETEPSPGDGETVNGEDTYNCLGRGDALDVDPMEYCEHIQSEVKKAKFRVAEKKIGESLTADQIAEEKELQRKQLEEIFKLMQEQNEKFGVSSVDDIHDQMKLYA